MRDIIINANQPVLPVLATAPTGVPVGYQYYDTGDEKTYVWDGTTWKGAGGGSGGGGAVDLSQRIYSPVDRALVHTPTFLDVGSYTWGGQWSAWRPVSITGVRLRHVGAGGHANQTLTFKIKDSAGADVRTCTVEVAGVGTYTGTWGSAWTPVIGDRWYLCQIGGSGVTVLADPDQASAPGRPFALDGALYSYQLHLYISGEAVPTAAQAGDLWAFEPVYTLT
jgi:hypothetical protein